MIRPVTANDAPCLSQIYNHYIVNSIATFEEQQVDQSDFASRIADSQSQNLPWLVYENDAGAILGYAYASKWKGRCAYRYSVEISVYLAANAVGKGIGTALYLDLFSLLQQTNIRVVIAGISLPNAASIALHEKLGMEKVAHFSEVGFKFGSWIDVGYWQKTFTEQSQ